VGETLAVLRDPFGFLQERQRRYGDVFRSNVLRRRVVFLAGLEGAEAFYDEANVTREDAHPFTLVDLFGGRNMEMFDGPRHLALKSMTLEAFGDEADAAYLPDLARQIEAALDAFATTGEVRAIPALRRLAIRLIWGSVMGVPAPEDAEAVTRDYGHVLRGLTAIPVPLPGTTYTRARAARDRLLERIRSEIVSRRARPTGDGLSTMLAARFPGAEPMTDDEAVLEVHHVVVAGFIVYLLLAEVVRRLAEDPTLRDRCEAEVREHVGPGTPTLEALSRLETCANVVREAKRIVPLVPLAFGRARRAFACSGYDVPDGWTVYLALHLLNHDPRLFAEPDRFDPDRFAPGRAEHERHAMAFIPQGAEPPTGHRCLGFDYSTAMVLTFLALLVRGYDWSLPPQDLRPDPKTLPPEPRDRLRVRFQRRP
jgi:cytochrome P450